jgi:hypothetical protein
MNVTIENFVGVFENAYSKEYCDKVIQYFETCHENGCSKTRQREVEGTLKTDKNDTVVWGDIRQDGTLTRPFNNTFWKCYGLYAGKYDVLKSAEQHNNYAYKVQKTEVGEGYHVWHFEADGRATSIRLLTWILYLNDVEEGGETEFLYYPKRIKPKTGTLIIWPGAYTHTHRGNPPISNTKYIVTGWIEF